MSNIKLFESKQIRSQWDEQEQKWYFSIVDIIAVLTESINHQAYWRKLKERLKKEGNETVTNCHALKMQAQSYLVCIAKRGTGCTLLEVFTPKTGREFRQRRTSGTSSRL